MAWATYSGLSLPTCVQCCGPQCAIEFISQYFNGPVQIQELPIQSAGTGDPNCDPTRTIDVTLEVVGDALTTAGTIVNGGSSATASIGARTSSGQEAAAQWACGSFSVAAFTGSQDMAGSGTFNWGLLLVYPAIRDLLFDATVTNIDATAEVGSCIVTVFAPIYGTGTSGTDEIAYLIANTFTGSACGGAGTIELLTDGTFEAMFVRARLVLTGLTIGVEYEAVMLIARRPIGTTDPWEVVDSVNTTFTAEAEIEYTEYFGIGGTSLVYEFTAIACTVDPTSAGSEYDACYFGEYEEGDGFDDGYSAGYSAGYAVGFICDPFVPFEPTNYYNGPDGTCEEGIDDGYATAYDQGYQTGYEEGYDEGFVDGGC